MPEVAETVTNCHKNSKERVSLQEVLVEKNSSYCLGGKIVCNVMLETRRGHISHECLSVAIEKGGKTSPSPAIPTIFMTCPITWEARDYGFEFVSTIATEEKQ